MSPKVLWNDQLRLVLSDVDETVADLYRPAEERMLSALSRLLERRIALVLITGQSVENVEDRVVMRLPAPLRQQIAVGACSGADCGAILQPETAINGPITMPRVL